MIMIIIIITKIILIFMIISIIMITITSIITSLGFEVDRETLKTSISRWLLQGTSPPQRQHERLVPKKLS